MCLPETRNPAQSKFYESGEPQNGVEAEGAWWRVAN